MTAPWENDEEDGRPENMLGCALLLLVAIAAALLLGVIARAI